MCKFASFVLTKDHVYWLEYSDSHREIIRINRLISVYASGCTNLTTLRISKEGVCFGLKVREKLPW